MGVANYFVGIAPIASRGLNGALAKTLTEEWRCVIGTFIFCTSLFGVCIFFIHFYTFGASVCKMLKIMTFLFVQKAFCW